jgi:hypothetical protein
MMEFIRLKQGIRSGVVAVATAMLSAGSAMSQVTEIDSSAWDGYLDYAYVYASADSDALRARLAQYGDEAGMTLDEYVTLNTSGRELDWESMEENERRRLAVAYLLQYLSTREPMLLDKSVEAVSGFEDTGRHEKLYWYRYIHAHRALEKGSGSDFTHEILQLWIDVVVPLESPYETLQALSLSQSANSGFASALPYVFENVSRMILLRSQEMGVHRDLDPLASVVRMLAQSRVGAHPDVIPLAASSKGYLDRIIARLDGAESDGGSLTFTLVLFEAGKYHDQARSLLASEGLSAETIKAIGVASGAYQTALNRAQTLQGQGAVYARVLRQLGEVWAAKQRLGVDPYVEMPFSIEGAMRVYRELFERGQDGQWARLGFRSNGHESYVLSLQTLWEEIQEASLNAADYYVTRGLAEKARQDDHATSAARTYLAYLSFFDRFASQAGAEYVPDSAYFAAYEAAKGFGDSVLVYSAANPTATEIDFAVNRYLQALEVFPFDRHLWSALAGALERQGRSNQYLSKVRPIADSSARSRHVDAWIAAKEPGTEALSIMRRAMSDELAVMYLGFANGAELGELEQSVIDLQERRAGVERELVALGASPASAKASASGEDAPPASIGESASAAGAARKESVVERAERNRKISEKQALLSKLDRQLSSRLRALPLFKATLDTDDLMMQLRSQRSYPVHTLLRRMYYEGRP